MEKEDKQIMGFTHFDRFGIENEVCEFLASSDKLNKFFRNKYLKISEASKDGKTFIGRLIKGPFFIPEEVNRDSAIAQTSILKGDVFPMTPAFYALGVINLLGEYRNNDLFISGTRPTPKSTVRELDSNDVKNIVGIKGNLLLGKLEGYENINIFFDEKSKKVLPRNIGIFGTVGTGKTNTSQVLIEEAVKAGYSVIVLDVEGEYVNMDKPSTESHLNKELESFGLKAEGVKDFNIYYPAPGDKPRNDAKKFDVKYKNFDEYILFELINTTDAQERAFGTILEDIKELKQESKETKRGPLTQSKKESSISTLKDVVDYVKTKTVNKEIPQPTGWALYSKLNRILRAGIFDVDGLKDIDPVEILKPGKVSIVDVSTVSEYIKNIVIVDLLNKLFDAKLKDANQKLPKVLLLIEEAHTFISKESKDRMEATLDMLKVIARRGRKRWLCLGFISQQPSHLPNEIFELCNTRIIHAIKSENNLDSLKRTSGGILEEIWKIVPALTVGKCLIDSPQFNHPIIVSVRPSKSERRFVD